MSDVNYQRRLSALRGHLRGAGFVMALEALEYAREFHAGRRKSGEHEFSHQLAMCFHALDLPGLMFPEETIATVCLHDTVEDYGQHHEGVILDRFGVVVHGAVMSVTKKIPVFVDGTKVHMIERDEDALFDAMSSNAIGSIVKGIDPSHNMKTMGGVFTREKQVSYVDFAEERVIPMMKRARRLFVRQYAAYALVQDKIESQSALVRSWAAAGVTA